MTPVADQTKIDLALLNALEVWSDATTFPVGFPMRPFEKPANGKYAVADIFHNLITAPIGSGSKNYIGLLQISVYWPSDEGTAFLTDKASEIAALFPVNQSITLHGVKVKFTTPPQLGSIVKVSDTEYFKPVSVSYHCSALQ